jgi:hypothetical protein
MSSKVKNNAHYLLSLLKYRKQARDYIKLATPNQVKAVCEIVANVVYGNLPIEEQYKRKLWAARKILKSIAIKGQNETYCKRTILKHWDKILIVLEAVKPFINKL